MTATRRGACCPWCGAWAAADGLDCICGLGRNYVRRKAAAAITCSLLTWAMACAIWLTARVDYWGATLLFFAAPLSLIALTSAVYGVQCGLIAVKGGGLTRVLGALALLLCAAFLAAPVVLLVAARLR